MENVRPLIVLGTRPEAIKLAPVYRACLETPDCDPVLCSTGQHKELLEPLLKYFELEPDFNLKVIKPGQSLSALMARCLLGLEEAVEACQPDCIIAQGDTTTVLAASMVAFFSRLPFLHVEAGLRTGNLQAPWPEEFNRRAASIATTFHFAPTERAANNLRAEGVPESTIEVTGNTVIDALLWAAEKETLRDSFWGAKYEFLRDRPMVLITGHRRENFGGGFQNICSAIGELADRFPKTAFVYPVHLNPNVQGPVHSTLGNKANVYLVDPAPYPEFVWLMRRSHLILTDSGGVQEEAPALKKPVVVMRETTERQEAVDAGAAKLVGTSFEEIVGTVSSLLTDPAAYASMQVEHSPFGDGLSSQRIVARIMSLGARAEMPQTNATPQPSQN